MNTTDERDGGRAQTMTTPILMALLLVTGLLVGGGVSYALLVRGDGATAESDECEHYRTVDLAVGPELYGVVAKAVQDVAPACTRVEPVLRAGLGVAHVVALGGEPPDIWIPESGFLLSKAFLGDVARLRRLSPSVAHTPVMLVGGASATRFDSWGEAEISGLVSVPDPESSTVGALAVVAPQAEAGAVGRPLAGAREMLVPFAQNYGGRRARGADVQVGPAMFDRRSRRLVVTTEQEMSLLVGRDDLRDLTPAVGAPSLDFPLAMRAGANPGTGAVARSLLDYLTSDEGRAAITGDGLRLPGDTSSPGPASGVTTLLPTPSGASIFAAVQSWRTLAVPSAILAVVDVSGSMDAETGAGSRMGLLADAAGLGLSFLPDHARVGLWVFSIDKGGPGQDWRVLEPIRRLDDLRFGRTQRYALRQRAAELPTLTDGGTGLYDTALAAYREAVLNYRPNYSNAVVLLTDGRNEDPGSIELDLLLERLRELSDPDRPVRLVGIAISEDADLEALEQMAHVTGGEAYLAAQPQDVLEVFARAVLSR